MVNQKITQVKWHQNDRLVRVLILYNDKVKYSFLRNCLIDKFDRLALSIGLHEFRLIICYLRDLLLAYYYLSRCIQEILCLSFRKSILMKQTVQIAAQLGDKFKESL